ncbi:hypothetical protein TNCV_3528961 [Trichonephila clavipes]|nr:hypothetical protein TNCV_3528961 [Trichonephila clavipes]
MLLGADFNRAPSILQMSLDSAWILIFSVLVPKNKLGHDAILLNREKDQYYGGWMCNVLVDLGLHFRPYRPKLVNDYLKTEDIHCMDWPARSPNLVSIKYVWDVLGRAITPHLSPPRIILELKTALRQEVINNLPIRERKPVSEEVITDIATGNCRWIIRTHCWYTYHRECNIPYILRTPVENVQKIHSVISKNSGHYGCDPIPHLRKECNKYN